MKIDKYGGSFLIKENCKHYEFWKKHFSTGWEYETFSFINNYLDINKTFIDIGAWIGPISLTAHSNSKQCICFEPDPFAYEEFKNNIEYNNINNIILEKCAVSVYKELSLGADILGDSVTRDSCESNKFTVNCISIEEIFKKYNILEKDVSVIKIDIEGHESELLTDEFLINLNIPMHISFHFEFVKDKNKFLTNIKKFLEKRNVNINTLNTNKNFSIGFI